MKYLILQILSALLFTSISNALDLEPSKAKDKIKIEVGNYISEIEGAAWSKHDDGTIPLNFTINSSDTVELQFGNQKVSLVAQRYWLHSNKHYVVNIVSVEEIFDKPLSFKQAKEKTLDLLSSLNMDTDELLQFVHKWKPSIVPPNNNDKFLLKSHDRFAVPTATANYGEKFRFKIGLTGDITKDLWQLGIVIDMRNKIWPPPKKQKTN